MDIWSREGRFMLNAKEGKIQDAKGETLMKTYSVKVQPAKK